MGILSDLFDAAVDFVTDVVETVSDLFDQVGDLIEDIPVIGWGVKALRAVKSWFEETDELDAAPSYNPETATIDETVKYNELLTKKRDEFTTICSDLERGFQEEAKKILSVFLHCVKTINEQQGLTISVEYIKNEFEKYGNDIKGGISDLVNRRLALSDTECAKILGHETGDKRSAEIDNFLKKIVREGSQKYMDNFDNVISRALSLVKDRVTDKVSEKETFAKKAKEELNSLNRDLSLSEVNEKREEFEHKIKVLSQVLV